jgi:GNAT superfamily N-acetyltransferase
VARVSVRVRPAEPADVPALVSLAKSYDLTRGTFSGRPLQDTSVEHLTERLRDIVHSARAGDGRMILVAVDESSDEVVGLVVARPDQIGAIDLTPALHVTHMLVAPKHRRRGVGRALLGAVVCAAENAGCWHVIATVGSGSREANRYLARLGFAPLVLHRVTSTVGLRRALGMSDATDRTAVLRRARLIRAQRAGAPLRAARRGA